MNTRLAFMVILLMILVFAIQADEIQDAVQAFVSETGESVTADDIVQYLIGETGGPTLSGPEYVFNSSYTHHVSAAALSDTTFVVAYSDLAFGTARVGVVSDGTISWGSETTFNPAVTSDIYATALSETKFVLAFRHQSMHGEAIVGTVSGTTISWGWMQLFNNGNTYQISATALSDTKFMVTYSDEVNANYGTARVGTVSGLSVRYAMS